MTPYIDPETVENTAYGLPENMPSATRVMLKAAKEIERLKLEVSLLRLEVSFRAKQGESK